MNLHMQKKILLVEDNMLVSMMEKKQLENQGYKVTCAMTADEAINIVYEKKENLDLILMDIDLGGEVDGTMVAKEILKTHDIPIIFLSSHTEKEIVEKTEKITSYGYVVKNTGIIVLDASIKMAFKLFEAKAKEHETNILLSSFIKNSPIYAYIKEVSPNESKVINASDNFEEMIGIEGSKMIGKTMPELFPPEFADKITADDWAVVESDKITELEENLNGKYYNTFKYPLNFGSKKWLAGYTIDVTKEKKSEYSMQIQHDLLLELNSCRDIIEGLNIILNTALKIDGIDCGGIYLMNEEGNSFDLVIHRGLSQEFIDVNTHHDSDSPRLKLISNGKVFYVNYRDVKKSEIEAKEKLKACAFIPIMSNGKLIAIFNLASHNFDSIPKDSKVLLETIALHISDTLLRLNMDAALCESEAKIKSISNNLEDSVIYQLVISPDGKRKFTYISDSVIKLYGITPEEVKKDASLLYSRIYKDDYDRFMLEQRKAIKNSSKFKIEVRMVDCNGNIRWSLFISSPKLMNDGSILSDGIETVINERKNIDSELQFYNSMFEKNQAIKLLVDPDTLKIVDANTFACKFYGYTHDELLSMKVSKINTLPLEEIKKEMELAKKEKRLNFQFKHRLSNGEIRDVDIFSGPIEIYGKTLLYSIIYDITKYKNIDKEIEESKNLFELIFNFNDDAIIITRLKEGLIININDSFTSLFGYTREEVIGKTTTEINIWGDLNDKKDMIIESREEGFCKNHEATLRKKDGSLFTALISTKYFTYQNQKYILAFAHDITNHKDVQNQDLEPNQLIYDIFDNNPVSMLITIPYEGKIISVNEPFLRNMGYSRDKVIGKTTLELGLFYDINDREKLINMLKKDNYVFAYECVFKTKTGNAVHGLLSIIFVEVKGILYQFSISVDLSKQKNMSASIQKMLLEKELLLRENNHRVKNNMSAIYTLLFLQADLQENPICKSILNDAATRMKNMILLYDKLYNSGNLLEQDIKEYLSPLINEMIKVFYSPIPITTNIDIQKFNLKIKALSSLGIIINELLTNSLKYAFKDRITGIINISCFKKDDIVTVIYEDNGIGLPESISFENTSSFGLFFINMLVRQINGSIAIERDKGTKYIIKIKV